MILFNYFEYNLIYLSEKANLLLNSDMEIFIGIMMRYQLEGRYPDYQPVLPSIETANDYLLKTKELLEWLKRKL